MKQKLLALAALAVLLAPTPSLAGADKPLVMESGSLKQLPSGTTLQLQAPTTAAATINLPHGSAPTSPVNGDCWTTTSVFSCRINGATATLSGSNSGDETSATILSKLSGASGGGTTNYLRADGTWSAPAGSGGGGGGGGSGGDTLIAETVTSGSQTSVTFSSIASTYRDLLLVVRGRGTASAVNVNILVQFNGDTGANYDKTDSEVHAGTGVIAGEQIASTSIVVGYMAAGTAPTNAADANQARIFDYAGTTFQKALVGQSGLKQSVSTGGLFVMATTAWWRSTAAINSLKVSLSSGGFVDGSVVSLYGIGGSGNVPAHKYEAFGTLPLSSSFTSDHVSNLTFTDGTYSLYTLWTASSSNTLQVRYQSAPATPYSVYGRFRAMTLGVNDQFGMAVRSSSTGKIVTFGMNRGGFISTQNWTNSTTFGSTALVNVQPENFPQWFRIKNDGTNLTFYYSWDGEQWTANGSESLAAFIGTADQIGFYVVPYNSGSAWITSFGTTTPS